jgi:hypothetical protein
MLTALGISSCGGNSAPKSASATDTTASGAVATRAQFVVQAARICQKVRAQNAPLKARSESLKALPEIEADKAFVSIAREAAAISRAAVEKLRALPRPPADAQAIDGLLRAYSEESGYAGEIAKAAASEESTPGEAAASALAKSIALHSTAAKRLGMGDCFDLE